MGYESAIPKDIAGTGLQITPTLTTWTEAYTFFDVDELINANNDTSDGKFALLEAYLSGNLNQSNNTNTAPIRDLAKPGDLHRVYKDTYCTGSQIGTFTDKGTTHMRQIASWAQPGDRCSVEYDTYQQTESRSFSVENNRLLQPYNLTTVSYQPTNTSLINQTNFMVPFVASLRVPSVLQSIRVTQWEAFTAANAAPNKILDNDRPYWNSDGIWGFDPGKLLYMGRKASSEGTALHRVTYTFLKNIYGWHHFYAIYQTREGLTPQDVVPIDPLSILPDTPPGSPLLHPNGSGGFKMLLGMRFADAFANLKQPFNTGPNPTQPPPTGVGDFNPMPDNVA